MRQNKKHIGKQGWGRKNKWKNSLSYRNIAVKFKNTDQYNLQLTFYILLKVIHKLKHKNHIKTTFLILTITVV